MRVASQRLAGQPGESNTKNGVVMRVQSQFRIGLAVVALIAALGGSAHAQPLQRLVFATDWLAQAEHGGFYQAIAEGTYAKYGLDVQIRMGGPAGQRTAAAGRGAARHRDGRRLQVMSAIEQEVPVVAIGATFQKNPTVLIAHPGVNRIEDLKGKTDCDRRSEQYDVLAGCGKNTGSPTARSGRTASPFSRFSPTDVVAARFRDVGAVLDREGRRAAGRAAAGRLRLPALCRSPRRDARDARREDGTLERFIRASAEGWRSYLAKPAPGNALIRQANPQMSEELLAYGVRKMVEYGIVTGGDARRFGLLTMSDARWQATIEFLRSVGLTKPGVDYRRAYTLDLVKAVRVVP